MSEITYWVCDACGVEDHWPRTPDGELVEQGKGVACSAAFYSRHSRKKAGKAVWGVRMLHAAGRGRDEARTHGKLGIWLCKECSTEAEHAAGQAALKVLTARGLKPQAEHVVGREYSEEPIKAAVLKFLAAGPATQTELGENLPAGMERDVAHAVSRLLDNRKIRTREYLVLREEP